MPVTCDARLRGSRRACYSRPLRPSSRRCLRPTCCRSCHPRAPAQASSRAAADARRTSPAARSIAFSCRTHLRREPFKRVSPWMCRSRCSNRSSGSGSERRRFALGDTLFRGARCDPGPWSICRISALGSALRSCSRRPCSGRCRPSVSGSEVVGHGSHGRARLLDPADSSSGAPVWPRSPRRTNVIWARAVTICRRRRLRRRCRGLPVVFDIQ